jgi:P-loop Domain of unknown function (DUF2791)
MSQSPDPKLARALIRSLTRGTAIRTGVRYIHVGHESWLKAQDELLCEVAEDGHSDTKFVRGAYGAGKSHFLSVVQDRAREAGWATCHVECKVDGVEIDRFETLYPKIASRLSIGGITAVEDGSDQPVADPARLMLDRWSDAMLRRAGIAPSGIRRPFDAETRVYTELHKGLLRSSLPADFTRALVVYVRAALSGDLDTMTAIARWLGGADERIAVPARYLHRPDGVSGARSSATVDLRPIGRGTAREVMRGLLWLVKTVGAKGLVLCIDEVEELARLPNRRRLDQALQALREFVDDAGGDGGYRYLCMYLAATPEMFEGPLYFPRYDALQTRIQPVGLEVSWRAPVVDLDRTPLQPKELHEMARRIWEVHRVAYGEVAKRFEETLLRRFVDAVQESRLRTAKPRLLARLLVDELERAREQGSQYTPPADIAAKLVETARQVTAEAKR